ncbi:YceD family protein [Inconstantimicrobium mannanitabidum]|uniref:Uncharacterized protein n=1 Tax=Inconstantimicrobium mannanitabidum TaxID=1604901 RepID=A0ACB5RB81_9CLOT|nr:DUF177 domain-containing protein [Clostridium sp. TW13]GKX66275.1 hypothetical protein rsdtw13_15330 [Clostridium sp. TW13]
MILDFAEIRSKMEMNKSLDFSIDVPGKTEFDGEHIEFLCPITVQGKLSLLDEIILLDVNLTSELKLTCSRCLETFKYPINLEMHEKFTNNISKEDEEKDLILLEGDRLDITEMVIDYILSTLPIKKLCNENCKGLCQHCGINLNKSVCNCDNEDVDIRFAALKDLFGNKEV